MPVKCRAKDPSTCRTHGQPQTESLNTAVEERDVSRYLAVRESMENDNGNASQTVDTMTKTVAEDMMDIARFKVSVCNDGNGPYIKMDARSKGSKTRYLSLTSGDDKDTPPTWRYWNSATPHRQYDSHLGQESTVKQVSQFLFKSFKQEMRDEDRDEMLRDTKWVPTTPRWPERTHSNTLPSKGETN